MQTNNNEKLINLVLEYTGLNQKSLSEKLGVSQTLITRWKQGDKISDEHSDTMKSLLGLEYMHVDIDDIEAMTALGGMENYNQWSFYADSYYARNHEHVDLPFPTDMAHQFHDNEPNHIARTLSLLVKCDVKFPKELPSAVATLINHEQLDEEHLEQLEGELEHNEGGILYEISTTLSPIMRQLITRFSYLNLCYALMTDEQHESTVDTRMELEFALAEFAICFALQGTTYGCKLGLTGDVDNARQELERFISKAKDVLISNNIPVADHLDNLVTYTDDELAHKIEAHQMGFAKPIGVLLDNDRNIHELLQQSQYQIQMLEAICRKLEIKL